ncbi:uncharacterized protein LOC124160716 [Ischnura elegans]|uniref:uncharacterized protein LOC124160716 n=1 Tax=Ischnura elegans TaxID=197161 RepID=UPI001ED878E7|nr:uncharacterized protein LOC124160716 [Ischnura elegans]
MTDFNDEQRGMKRCMKMTRKQSTVLVEYMEEHQDFALGRFDSYQKSTLMMKMWKELKSLLDMHGAPKTLDQWRRTWKDYRSKIRAKNARIEGERSSPGKEGTSPPLSNLEMRVLALIGPKPTRPVTPGGPRPWHIPANTKESPQIVSDESRCINTVEEMPEIIPVTEVPDFHPQPTVQTRARSILKPRPVVTVQRKSAPQPAESERSKNDHDNDQLDGILSKLDLFRDESLEVMKVIANGVTSIAQSQREILNVQKERLEVQREMLELERKRLENRTKMESMLRDVVECQKSMANSLEHRPFIALEETKQDV